MYWTVQTTVWVSNSEAFLLLWSSRQPTVWWPPDFSEKAAGTMWAFLTFQGVFYFSPRTRWSGSQRLRRRCSTKECVSRGWALSSSPAWCPPAWTSCRARWSVRRRVWRWSRASTDRNKRSFWTLWSLWQSCWTSEIHPNTKVGLACLLTLYEFSTQMSNITESGAFVWDYFLQDDECGLESVCVHGD